MVRIGNADLGIGARAGFARQLERDHAGDVALQRQHLQVEHQPRVVGVSGRHAHRAIEIRQWESAVCGLGFLNAALHLADRIEILADLGAVARAELLLKAGDVFGHPIEKAGVLPQFGAAVGRAAAVAEQALENDARMSLGRKRRGGRRPGEIVLVDAGIAVVALADRGEQIHGQLERRQPRLLPICWAAI